MEKEAATTFSNFTHSLYTFCFFLCGTIVLFEFLDVRNAYVSLSHFLNLITTVSTLSLPSLLLHNQTTHSLFLSHTHTNTLFVDNVNKFTSRLRQSMGLLYTRQKRVVFRFFTLLVFFLFSFVCF